MKFGIVITSFRQPEYLKEAIESIFKQEYHKPFQLIIVDDSDEKSCIQMELPDRSEIDMIYIKNEKNLGVQKSYNLGCLYINDDVNWIIRLDGDDQLLPNALSDLEEFLNEHDNRKLGFVYSDLKVMGSEKIRIYPEWIDGSIVSLENIGHLQAIKKSVAEEIGHFDITLKYGHDTDQIIRVIEKGYQIKHIPKVLYYNRLHPEQYTQKFAQNNNPQYYKNLIYQKALQRRPDIWVEGRQQVIMQTSGSHLWRSEVEAIQKWIDKGLNFLDLGCSNKKKLSSAIGVDLDRNGGKCPELVWNANEALPFKNGTLDGIIASHCLEHIKDPILAINEWSKIIKSGGRLILVIPDTNFTPKMGTPEADPTHLHDWVLGTFKVEILDKLDKNEFKILYHAQIGNHWSFLTILEKI